jgi:signal peptidase II
MLDESQEMEQITSSPEPQQPGTPPKATWQEQGIVFLVMALVLLADHLSKAYVEGRFPLNSTWAPFPEWESFFRITHVSNTGAAFGLFQSGSTVLSIVAIIVSVIIVIYNRYLPGHMYWYRLALGLQLGGALGNLLSRIRLGHVTDFLDFGPVPVFNLADTSIVTGTILLGFLMIFYPPEAAEEPSVPDADGEDDETAASKDQSLLLNE